MSTKCHTILTLDNTAAPLIEFTLHALLTEHDLIENKNAINNNLVLEDR